MRHIKGLARHLPPTSRTAPPGASALSDAEPAVAAGAAGMGSQAAQDFVASAGAGNDARTADSLRRLAAALLALSRLSYTPGSRWVTVVVSVATHLMVAAAATVEPSLPAASGNDHSDNGAGRSSSRSSAVPPGGAPEAAPAVAEAIAVVQVLEALAVMGVSQGAGHLCQQAVQAVLAKGEPARQASATDASLQRCWRAHWTQSSLPVFCKARSLRQSLMRRSDSALNFLSLLGCMWPGALLLGGSDLPSRLLAALARLLSERERGRWVRSNLPLLEQLILSTAAHLRTGTPADLVAIVSACAVLR